MKINVLIMGADLNIQQLMVDIVEITFDDIVIERAHTTETLFQKLSEQEKKYNLVIINSTSGKESDEALIMDVKAQFESYLDHILMIFSPTDEKPSEILLKDITHVTRPFSLDVIGDIMKRVCCPAEVVHEKK